jgi:peptide deformylase
MGLRKIYTYGEPILRRKCTAVRAITPEIRALIADMFATMYAAPGVGLAAPQVGMPVRICVIDTREGGKNTPLTLINPRIVAKSAPVEEEEGCLSFPGLAAKVTRPGVVQVEAVDDNGLPVTVEGHGLLARALQHEIDHLDGKMYIDYLSWWKRKKLEQEIRARKKQGTW